MRVKTHLLAPKGRLAYRGAEDSSLQTGHVCVRLDPRRYRSLSYTSALQNSASTTSRGFKFLCSPLHISVLVYLCSTLLLIDTQKSLIMSLSYHGSLPQEFQASFKQVEFFQVEILLNYSLPLIIVPLHGTFLISERPLDRGLPRWPSTKQPLRTFQGSLGLVSFLTIFSLNVKQAIIRF